MNHIDALREHVAELPHAKLVEAQKNVSAALSDLPKRQSELCRTVEQAEAKAQRRERVLMLEHGHVPTDDPELVGLRDVEARARAALRELSQSESKLRELAGCLRDQLSINGMELEDKASALVQTVWRPLGPEMREDAYESLVAAILATAAETGAPPSAVDPALFVQNFLPELHKRVKEAAAAQMKQAREDLCKNDPRLG